MWKAIICGWLILVVIALTGCVSTTAPPLPKANLSEPGWTVQEGQAVWHRKPAEPEIAGDLLLATRPDGSAFVQFSKAALPFLIARINPGEWQVEAPTQNKRYLGHGKPPKRVIWFQLVDALTGKPLARGWHWNNTGTNWRLENSSSGESLEGFLSSQ